MILAVRVHEAIGIDCAREAAEVLRRVADRIEAGEATGLYQNAHDRLGAPVGTWKFKLDGFTEAT